MDVIIERAGTYLSQEELVLIQKTYEYARDGHE
jgi:hypothetical protein